MDQVGSPIGAVSTDPVLAWEVHVYRRVDTWAGPPNLGCMHSDPLTENMVAADDL
jgi:hypothetical protein